jgi:hypothetical protein
MTPPSALDWIDRVFVAPMAIAVLLNAIFRWNWLGALIERMTMEKTRRVPAIDGDIRLKFGWPLPRIHGRVITFASRNLGREYRLLAANDMLSKKGSGVAKRSLHMDGRVIGRFLPGGSLAEMRRAAIDLKAGRGGYCPAADFVYVNVGRVRTW